MIAPVKYTPHPLPSPGGLSDGGCGPAVSSQVIILAGREILTLPRPPLWEGKPGATRNTQKNIKGMLSDDNKTDTSFNVLWSTQGK